MNVLDTSIANVSIPTISGDLGVSTSQGTWVITSFAVANAITVPLTGWLTQRFGRVRLFLMSTLLFVLASWLCGFSPSLEALIAFRVLQGAVAGPMIPLSQALMLASFPKSKAGMALAVWSMTTLVAPWPALAGRLDFRQLHLALDLLHQRAGRPAGRLDQLAHLPRPRIAHAQAAHRQAGAGPAGGVGRRAADHAGQGQELDWFASPTILILAAVAVVAFVFFLIWERPTRTPWWTCVCSRCATSRSAR